MVRIAFLGLIKRANRFQLKPNPTMDFRCGYGRENLAVDFPVHLGAESIVAIIETIAFSIPAIPHLEVAFAIVRVDAASWIESIHCDAPLGYCNWYN